MVANEYEFRFYGELNDFLAQARRRLAFAHRFQGTPSAKDAIEAIGVPHAEPVFERFDIAPAIRLRPLPMRGPRFIADVNLGTLARYLRLLSFDTRYANHPGDAELVRCSVAERRDLGRRIRPSTRCMRCNCRLCRVTVGTVACQRRFAQIAGHVPGD